MTSFHAIADDLKPPLAVSSAAHGILLAVLLVAVPFSHRGEPWGGPGGGAIQVNAVSSLPGVPLPRPPIVTESRTATESPGLHKALPKKPEAETKAAQLPRFGEKKPERVQRARREEPQPEPPPGAIPSGGGGPAAVPYTSFQVGASEGGLAVGEGGSFGSRYPWYVESVRRRVSGNWLLASVDPYVKWAPRVVVTFEILRDGTVVNIQTLQSSGEPSVDRSAIRAIRDSSPLDRLPGDYRGDKVLVEFWFDFRRP